ncbi:MAG: hypothetical protein KKC23_08350, partial [Proteobacteria bacterium]|nr:hypothetical protein [Pseudomonadota bacterium]
PILIAPSNISKQSPDTARPQSKTLLSTRFEWFASKIDWADGFSGATFQSNHSNLVDNKVLDCGLAVSGDCFDMFDGAIRIGPSENSLAYFIFRLLQKLQSLGTVPAIDWNAYAEALGN